MYSHILVTNQGLCVHWLFKQCKGMCFEYGWCDGLDSARRANPISEGSYVKGERHAVNIVDVYVLYMILRCVCTVHTVWITRALKVKHMYWFLGGMCVIFSGPEGSDCPALWKLVKTLSSLDKSCQHVCCCRQQWPWIETSRVPLKRLLSVLQKYWLGERKKERNRERQRERMICI